MAATSVPTPTTVRSLEPVLAFVLVSDFSPPTPDLFSSPTLTVPSLIIVTSLLGG